MDRQIPPPTPAPERAPATGRVPTAAADMAPAALGLLAALDPGVLLALAPAPDGRVDVSVRAVPADERCGGAGLFGIAAPVAATVAGCSFRAHPAEPERGGHVDGQRLDVLVARDGRVLSQVHEPDGTVTELVGPAAGVVVDALHRVLGRPSPGDPPPLEALVSSLWLADLVTRAREVAEAGADGPTWADAVHLHPCPPASSVVLPSPEALAGTTRSLVADVTWERLRRSAAAGRAVVPDLSAEEADWMDDTLFGRWVVESFPPPRVSLALLEHLGGADAATGVRSVLGRLGVDVGGM